MDALDDISSLSAGSDASSRALFVGGPAELITTVLLPKSAVIAAAIGSPIHFTFGLADDMLESMRAGRLDAVVSSIRPRIRGVETLPLYDEVFSLVAAPLWAKAGHTWESLAEIPVVAYADDLPVVRRCWRTVFQRRPAGLRLAAVIPDLRGISEAVVSGLGMSVLPRYLIAYKLRAGALVELFEPAP